MKEKFTYSSDIGLLLIFPTFLVVIILTVALNKFWYGATVVSGILLLLCLLLLLISSFVPCSFEAQETEIRFIKAFIKTDVIKYSDIRSMEITREHNDTRYGTKWVETICFDLGSSKLTFSAAMDIDYDAVAKNPTYLTKQFETSQFSQLKRFIESKMDTIQGGISNV